MSLQEFETQFGRLTAHFHLPADDSRDTLAIDWFKALEHYHVDAFDHAITELTKISQDRFWPPLGKVVGTIRARIDKYERAAGKCATCHGATWIESAPFKSNVMIYENVVIRCPDCGIPAPQYTASDRRQPLTSREYAEWRIGDDPKQFMPSGLEAKPWKSDDAREAHRAEMKAAFESLSQRLFGDRE